MKPLNSALKDGLIAGTLAGLASLAVLALGSSVAGRRGGR